MREMDEDRRWMNRALSLAAKGRPSPNPHVGAVIVKNGKNIGEGYHHRAGMAHAEVEAIKNVEKRFGARALGVLAGSALYVNLEPCNHTGRTGPCTTAILEAGIRRVVFAMKDPNPRVRGGGGKKLLLAGVKIKSGILEPEAKELNVAFIHHAKTGRPFVTLKMAMTLDGKIATRTRDSKWVGGKEELQMVQRLRDKAGAVMVGVGTVLKDNPRLTCRLKGGHSPLRVIVDSELKIPLKAKVLADDNVIIAVGPKHDRRKAHLLAKRGIRHVLLPLRRRAHVNLKELMKHLGKMGINHVLCEGGPDLAGGLVEEKLVNEILFFIAPKVAGGKGAPGPIGGLGVSKMAQAKKVRIVSVEPVGEDWLVWARFP